MNNSDIYKINSEIDKIAYQYSETNDTNLRNQIVEKLYNKRVINALYKKRKFTVDYDDFSSIYSIEMIHLIDSYKHEKNTSFMAYFYKYINIRMSDALKHMNGKIIPKSLDEPVSDEEDITLADILKADDKYTSEQADINIMAQHIYLSIMNSLIAKKMAGSKRNMNDYSIDSKFFSETTVIFSKEKYLNGNYVRKHEKTAFSVVDCPFLDYILEDKCRDFDSVEHSECKEDIPLKNAVYVEYLGKFGNGINKSTISRKRQKYNDYIMENIYDE